jgi:transketolase
VNNEILKMALTIRRYIVDISYHCNLSTHLGGALSIVEIMSVLYGQVLKFDVLDKRWEDRDRFILSKGHGVLTYFSTLLFTGFITRDKFETFQTNLSDLIAHPVMNLDLGIESSNGSLGQGLSMGVGIAIAAKKKKKVFKTYVLLGDGECNEGSIWEAIMSASQFQLDNLIAIVDFNKLQSDGNSLSIMDLGDLIGKFNTFGWDVREINGHDISQIVEAFNAETLIGKPRVIVANTVKGMGISFMENNNDWHHSRLTKGNYDLAVEELNVLASRYS